MNVKVHHVVINIFHIGVGSNVVCSTIPGNAKASGCGTGNKDVPTLFCARIFFKVIISQKGTLACHEK